MAAKQKSKPRPAGGAEASTAARAGAADVESIGAAPRDGALMLLVFVAGAVLMGLEIVGSRLLAPHFGNSVFVWGSLISLFLIALSAGYYGGGLLADRRPSRALLNSIVIAVAAWMLVIPAMAAPVCEALVQAQLGEKAGPFVASAILFLLPSIGMGMVSPFAVRLATHAVASVGKTAGTLYALSTFGSIAGTMLTTFVLIPTYGTGAILKGLALTLLATALATFPFASAKAASAIVAVVAAAAVTAAWAISPARLVMESGSKLVADVDTPYHHISVVDAPLERQLRFDKFTETSIWLRPPHESRSPYTNYFHLAFLPQPTIRRALFIGAGGGVGPRTFHAHDPAMDIEVVDVDAKVLELARTHFYLDDAPQIKMIAADGRSYVRGAEDGAYECIVLDAFSIGGRIPFHLVTREFIALCRTKLAPGGVFLMNINSALSGDDSRIFRSMRRTVAAAFPANAHAFLMFRTYYPPEASRNIILVGINAEGAATREDWETWGEAYQPRAGAELDMTRARIAEMVEDLVTTLPDLSKYPVFTDDYAPIETMSF